MSERVEVKSAVERLKKRGYVLSRHGDIMYVDADCDHCGSRYKVGELTIDESDETVDAEAVQEILEE